MAETHTPLPWKAEIFEGDLLTEITILDVAEKMSYRLVLNVPADDPKAYHDEAKANAALIVKCCNAYPALVEALKRCVKGLDGCSSNSVYKHWRKEAMEALKQAGEL